MYAKLLKAGLSFLGCRCLLPLLSSYSPPLVLSRHGSSTYDENRAASSENMETVRNNLLGNFRVVGRGALREGVGFVISVCYEKWVLGDDSYRECLPLARIFSITCREELMVRQSTLTLRIRTVNRAFASLFRAFSLFVYVSDSRT